MLQRGLTMAAGDHDDLELDPLRKEAVGWVRRLTSGAATMADADELRQWRDKSPEHAAAFAAASLLWRDLGKAGETLRRRDTGSRLQDNAARRIGPMSRRAFVGGGLVAASVAAGVYVAARPPLELWPSLTELSADYRTGAGEQRNVAVSDNVSIRLNTRTSIARQSSDEGGERLKLIAGEASFATARQGRTLIVEAADSEMTATAARFDVRYLQHDDGASVCATCLRGELRVARGGDRATVMAGQQLRYDAQGEMQVRSVDIDVMSAWHDGVLIFRATPLSEVVTEVNRYRAGRIIVTSAALGRAPVSGRFRISRLDDILTQIEQAFGARMRALPGGIVLLS